MKTSDLPRRTTLRPNNIPPAAIYVVATQGEEKFFFPCGSDRQVAERAVATLRGLPEKARKAGIPVALVTYNHVRVTRKVTSKHVLLWLPGVIS